LQELRGGCATGIGINLGVGGRSRMINRQFKTFFERRTYSQRVWRRARATDGNAARLMLAYEENNLASMNQKFPVGGDHQ